MAIEIMIGKLKLLLCQKIKIRTRRFIAGQAQDALVNGKDIQTNVFVADRLARQGDRNGDFGGWQGFFWQVKVNFDLMAVFIKRDPFRPDGTERTMLILIQPRTICGRQNIGATAPFFLYRDAKGGAIARQIELFAPENVFVRNGDLKAAFKRGLNKSFDVIARFDVIGLNTEPQFIWSIR